MSNPHHWYDVWQRKGERFTAVGRRPSLVELVALAGYDSPTSVLDLTEFDRQRDYIVRALHLTASDAVYEVGCGPGALLFALAPLCAHVGGSDYAPALVDIARRVLTSDDLHVAAADEVSPHPRYDVVLSNGVFIYFPHQEYARRVLTLMAAKARRAVGVFDINDLSTREQHQAERRLAYGEAADSDLLQQLYLDRSFFPTVAHRIGMTCAIENSVMTGSINGRYRYNAILFHKDASR